MRIRGACGGEVMDGGWKHLNEHVITCGVCSWSRTCVAKPQYVVLLTTGCKCAEKKIEKNCPQAGFEPSTSACEPSELWEGVDRPSHTCKASVV